MIDHFKEVSEFAKLEIPESHKLPIAIVGAGGIVDGAHLPAYKKAGLEIVGITDVDQDRAKDVASRHGISIVYPDLVEPNQQHLSQIYVLLQHLTYKKYLHKYLLIGP